MEKVILIREKCTSTSCNTHRSSVSAIIPCQGTVAPVRQRNRSFAYYLVYMYVHEDGMGSKHFHWYLELLIIDYYNKYGCQIFISFYGINRIYYRSSQKEITYQTDKCLVILSSKTYVFEDKLTK